MRKHRDGQSRLAGHGIVVAFVAAWLSFTSGWSAASTGDGSIGAMDPVVDAQGTDVVTGTATSIAAGRTPGVFGVAHSGAATYRIPLWMPPGVGAVQLELALLYNSRGANGTLGVGWSISGLSAITRCNRTWAQDGAPAGVTNTFADRFCLDGQQLKLVSGSYGNAGSIYGTELDAFARIEAMGVMGNGPASFTVTSKNGLVYEYGFTTDSRVFAGSTGTVRTWALSRIRDRAAGGNGNSIGLSYFNDAQAGAYGNGSFRIASISYPTTATGMGPFYQVSFGYSARPVADVPSGYLAGNAVREPNRLDSIRIQSIGVSEPIKTYSLGYGSAPTTGRLRLTSVQECGPSSCLRPTTIGYQDGASGWQSALESGVSASALQSPVPMELNGDGLTDLLYPVDAGTGKYSWRIALATTSGYATPVDTGLVTGSSKIIPGSFLGNGRSQFLIQQNGYWYVAGFGTGGFVATSTGLVPDGEYGAADLDGDGLADLMSQSGGFTPSIYVRRNVTNPTNGTLTAQFATTSQLVWTIPSPRQATPWDNLRIADLNGDGRADIVALTYINREKFSKFIATPLLSNGFGMPFTVGTEASLMQESMVGMGDWNADGCSDIFQLFTVYVSNCAGSFAQVATRATPATGDRLYTVMPADWNADGRTDLLYIDAASSNWYVVPSLGTTAGTPTTTGIWAPTSTKWFVHDVNGDGLDDLGLRDGNAGNRLRYRLHAAPTAPPDLATAFTDGFGMRQNVTYVSIARSLHARTGDAVFPEVDFQVPLYVVSEFSAADGTGGTYRNQFQYFGARLHLQGRGFEGFHAQRIYDTRTGLVTYDYVQRAFPFTGMHTQRSVFQGDGTTRVGQWTAEVAAQVTGGVAAEQRVFPYVASRSEQRYELGGALNGALVTDTRHSYVYGDGYGNPTQVQTSVTDKDPNSPFFNSSWQSTTSLGYANDASLNWCLGLPNLRTTTATVPGQASRTRTTTFAVDTTACRVTQQVLEPDTPALKAATSYGFDSCGNLNNLRVVGSEPSGSAMPARTTSFAYGARCQLPESVTNALGQTTAYSYRWDFGLPTRASDPNGQATTWSYDEFARRTVETRPDGTRSAWTYESCAAGPCWGANDLRFAVYESRLATDGTLINRRELMYDGLERPRTLGYHRAFGLWTTVSYGYDALGRPITESRPFSSGRNGQTNRSYDALGRLTSQSLLDASGALVHNHAFTYAGRTTTIVDPLGRIRTSVADVLGRLRRTTDPAPGGTTRFDYDALGNLNRIEDPIGAVSSGNYNVLGFRTQWRDADAGTWSYFGNSLNEPTAWTDANGRSFGAAYDLLGRLTSRSEPEGTSRWTWGTSAAAHNIGRLQSKAGLGYSESFEYDQAGRTAVRKITTDQGYRYDFAYNPAGTLDTVTYPSSPIPAGQASARFKIRYGYSYGTPSLIEDITDSQPRALWSLTATNDDGQVTTDALSAGAIAASSTFDAATGRLLGRQSGSGSTGSGWQDLRYAWDATGNLLQRHDAIQNLTETFTVDALDRLTGSSLNGVPNLAVAYDASGNVTHKSDVGSYVYGDGNRPHAVTTAGAETLAYDANGNVVTRNGHSQQWASFNLPTSLQKSGYQSQFAYGPDHQRWRQVATYLNGVETTHYVGGLLEKEATTSTGRTYWRHYVPTPGGSTVVVSRNSDATTSTTYLLTDHLGSSETLVSDSGALQVRESFAAFGSRRGSNWRSSTAPDWLGIANATRQGFTSHEMLDNVGLVHMNGRVYDPALGRFLSADPLIGDVTDTQAVNPYAYAGNRPLVAIDPTGLAFVYVPDGVCGGICGSFVASAIATVTGLLGHHSAPPPPPATALPGQSAQNGVGLCGPGTFSPTCGGMVLYAGAPAPGSGGPGTSSWHTSVEDQYAQENLEKFLIDLGINAVDVLVLAPYYDAQDAYGAARDGDYLTAVLLAGVTTCEVAKPCAGLRGAVAGVGKLASTTGVKRQFVQAADRVFYRVYSSNTIGKWVTAVKPRSSAWAQEALSLPPGNTANYLQEVKIPAGTRLERSRASPMPEWNRQRGGAEQFEILDLLPPSSFGDGKPLP